MGPQGPRSQSGHVPVPRDPFVGREAELAEIEHLVRVERWVVLTGPGGTGKTRLSVQVARRVQATLPGGAWAFDLAPARSEAGICAAVAAGLGPELDKGDPVALVIRAEILARDGDLEGARRGLDAARLAPGHHGARGGQGEGVIAQLEER